MRGRALKDALKVSHLVDFEKGKVDIAAVTERAKHE